MKPEDLIKAPKMFCENIMTGINPEYFIMGFFSGSQASIFTLTPEHAKRFLQKLTHDISQYEKTHGEIKAEWNPNIVSPVQSINEPGDKS